MPNTQNPVYAVDQSAKVNLDRTAQLLTVSFARECGFRPLPWMQRQFKSLLEEGFEYLMLVEVISQTSHAPRPSWAYLAAILRRCRASGIFSLVDFVFMPQRQNDQRYREMHFMDNIPDDVIDEAIKNFEQ